MSELNDEVPFPELLATSRRHRDQHQCGAYPYEDAGLLVVLAGAFQPRNVVEVGTAIGYTSICMAHAAPDSTIDTIDSDSGHARIASANFAEYEVHDRVTAHVGDADDVLPALAPDTYDLAFFDGFAPTATILSGLRRLLRVGGLLVCANLTLGGTGAAELNTRHNWAVHSFGETALALRRPPVP